MARIHILRPGKFRDLKGREVNLTQQDMERMAAGYERNSAPVIVGHRDAPEDPAHGWARSLSADARGLWAEVPRLTAQMKGWIKEGRYKKVSAKILRGADGWGVRHIGMLGARQPAVSGLDPVELAAGDEPGDVIFGEVELAAPSGETKEPEASGGVLSLASRAIDLARDVLSGRRNDDPPSSRETGGGEGGSQMSDEGTSGGRQGGDGGQASELAEQRIADLEKRLAASEARERRASANATVKSAVDAGRLLPRDEEPMTAVLAALADVQVDGEPLQVELASADEDGEPRELSAYDYVADYLDRAGVQVPQGEVSGATGAVSRPALGAQPTEAELSAKQISDRAQKLMRENEGMSLADAQVQASIELAGPLS